MVTKSEGDGVVIRGWKRDNVGRGNGVIWEECDNNQDSVKPFHDISSPNSSVAPSVSMIFWGNVN